MRFAGTGRQAREYEVPVGSSQGIRIGIQNRCGNLRQFGVGVLLVPLISVGLELSMIGALAFHPRLEYVVNWS